MSPTLISWAVECSFAVKKTNFRSTGSTYCTFPMNFRHDLPSFSASGRKYPTISMGVSILYYLINQRQLLIQQKLLTFGQFDSYACHPDGFCDNGVEAGERCEGRKLRSAVIHAHVCGDFLPCDVEASGCQRKDSSVRESFVTYLVLSALTMN